MKNKDAENLYNEKYKLYDTINLHLVSLIDNKKKVLDVGCNTGKLGEYLRFIKECQVFGVDISAEAIHQAKNRLDRAEMMDIERDDFPFEEERFDVIIFGDILEHLIFPVQTLTKFKKYLKKDGKIIASIPNVANILIRLKLLIGKWEYQELGILDNSHLRFFTFHSMKQMFDQALLRVIKYDWIPGRYVSINNRFWIKLSELMARFFPTLFATQFLFETKPYESHLRL
jgi:2-polyprenyl-3-methyl-5-hydroxy-6-metoxy-1,4-benzoquinol methylase